MKLRTLAPLLTALILAGSAPQAQDPYDAYYELPWDGVGFSFSKSTFEGFYDSLAPLGDLDGDGVVDFARGSAQESLVEVFSGARVRRSG